MNGKIRKKNGPTKICLQEGCEVILTSFNIYRFGFCVFFKTRFFKQFKLKHGIVYRVFNIV